MKHFVLGAIVGALVGALIGYLVWGRVEGTAGGPGTGGNPHSAVIVLEGGPGDDCKAKIDQFRIGNTKTNKVYWTVDFDRSQCHNDNGNWRLELRFDDAANGTAWNNGPVEVRAQGTTPWRIPETANIGVFPYHVWMIGTRSYEMADPELEIEQ